MAKLLSTVDGFLFLYIILVILFLFLSYFSYLFFKKHIYQDLQKFLYHIKITLYILFIIFCILTLISKRIIIEIRAEDKYSSIIWTIIIALLMGIYINICFGTVGLSRQWQKYMSMLVLAYLCFSGFGYIGIRIIFNLPYAIRLLLTGFWHEDIFQSNTPKGLYFFAGNLPFFLILWALSFSLQGEKRER